MNGFETIIFEKVGHVAYITLNRPETLNAHSVQMRDDMVEALGAIIDDDEVRVTILKGAGDRAFCTGADLSEFLTAPPPTAAREVRFDRDLWGLLLSVPQPIIAALHGYVLGSGIEMAVCCDLRFASDDARFGLPEMGLGMIPAAGGTQTVPRAMGLAKALEMTLTNRWIDADAALAAGLVNRVVPREALSGLAEETALKIAESDSELMRRAKRAIWLGLDLPLAQGLELEARISAGYTLAVR